MKKRVRTVNIIREKILECSYCLGIVEPNLNIDQNNNFEENIYFSCSWCKNLLKLPKEFLVNMKD